MSNVLDAGVRAYLRMRFTCRVHRADGKLIVATGVERVGGG